MQGPTPHESEWQMWVPLAILAFFAAIAGLFNAHALHLTAMEHWLEPVFSGASKAVKNLGDPHHVMWPLLGAAVVIAAAGAGGAYWVYVMQQGRPAKELTEKAPGFYELVRDKWRIDELYEATFIGAVETLADIAVWVDKWIVDGIVARLTAFVVAACGTVLRFTQTGRVQAYAAVMVLGLGGLGWFFLTPRADARIVENHATGAYSVTAAPGFGYSYRWDENGDGKFDSASFGSRAEISFNLDVAQKRKVYLQVKNAFGQVAGREFDFERERPDKSGAGKTETINVRPLKPNEVVPPRRELPPGHPALPAAPQVNP